jgi:SAM-dependent methyltransferase
MANAVFRTAGRVLKWPMVTLIRPWPWLNARVWDLQYALGLWKYLDRADGPAPLDLIGRYSARPRILDLGCGTTVNLRLTPDRYSHYHGVDISRAAIQRARALRRPDTTFEVADVLGYRPTSVYDVILLREVLYYLPVDEAAGMLLRLAQALTPHGAIIVSIYDDTIEGGALLDAVRGCGLPVAGEATEVSPQGRRAATLVLRPAGGR